VGAEFVTASPRRVSVFGSTGSIGVSTLDLLDRAGADVEVVALAAGRNAGLLAEQARRWRPKIAILEDESGLPQLRASLAGEGIETAGGAAAITEAATRPADWVMSAIVGAAGLAPTLAAARTGATIALANKESLICAGPALLEIARCSGGSVLPVDSEHSAIFQVLDPGAREQVFRLILTASGGPFRTWTLEQMRHATPEQAVAHPKWSMGPKISVDSATMMNKGLEMIEASYLFEMPAQKIEVLIHPQSVVHSLVEYVDGSTLAQLGPPDMRTPIACAYAWPHRLDWPAHRLNLAEIGQLTFEAPDEVRFPALKVARLALERGEGAPAAVNAANEVAVAGFLDRRIGFLDIAAAVIEALERLDGAGELRLPKGDALENAMRIDRRARHEAALVLSRFTARR
jgi:1-deoxy-D-xylulose-5-phosphate reductoisomerase